MNISTNFIVKTVTILVALGASAGSHAAFIGTSTGAISDGSLSLLGLGELRPGTGIGTTRWTQGACSVVSSNTQCTMSGNYIDSVGGDGTAGGGGQFTFRMEYTGTGSSPALSRSTTAGNDDTFFFDVGSAIFTLSLRPLGGGMINSVFPTPSAANQLNFSMFFIPGAITCTGLAAGRSCGAGQVGLVPGATATGNVRLSFSIPTTGAVIVPPTSVPVPGTLSILGAGLIGLLGAKRRLA
jgi:hypothetical protein